MTSILPSMRNFLLIFIIVCISTLFCSKTYSAGAGNFSFTPTRYDYGKQLVGSAFIDFNVFHWDGADASSVLMLSSGNGAFGFTGNYRYLPDPFSVSSWASDSTKFVTIGSQPFNDVPPLNHFFAPNQAGDVTSIHHFTILSPYIDYPVTVSGTGVNENDPKNPALTLTVLVSTNTANNDSPKSVCTEENQQSCGEVSVSPGGAITFRVIPQVDSKKVRASGAELPNDDAFYYAFVELLVQEKESVCSQNHTFFKDRGEAGNRFNPWNYYHYLNKMGPYAEFTTCTRYYTFLASVNDVNDKTTPPEQKNSFTFTANNNNKNISLGNVQYEFYVAGHYKGEGGSYRSFQLTTDPLEPTPLPPQPPSAILTPSLSEGAAPLTVTFDGSGSQSFVGDGILSYQWKLGGEQAICGNEPTCTHTFCQGGDYQVTLMVTDSLEKPSTPDSKSVAVKPFQYPAVTVSNAMKIDELYSPTPEKTGVTFSGSFLASLASKEYHKVCNDEPITVAVMIKVQEHVENAELIVVAQYASSEPEAPWPWWIKENDSVSPSISNFPSYSPLSQNSSWTIWDGTISKLTGFHTQNLEGGDEGNEITLYNDLLKQGYYTVYMGYRLSGTTEIIYDEDPIKIQSISNPNPR